MTPEKPKKGWLNQGEMAASVGVSTQAFSQWNVEPVGKIGRISYYTCEDVISNRVTKRESGQTRTARNYTMDDERARLTSEQADNMKLKNAQLRRELAPIGLLRDILGDAGHQIAAILAAVPLNVKKRIPRLATSEVELIKREIVKAQNVASNIQVKIDDL